MNEERLLEALNSSVKDLQQRIDLHFDLVDRFLEDKTEGTLPETPVTSFPSKSREYALKTAIREAIDTLEETRKAFKSKTLEALRKKLTQVLIDLN
jgi:uncharacterized coiled-coil protein SlyX